MNCPTCNRSSKEYRFIGDFCEYCAAETAKKLAPLRVEVEQCRLCSRVRIKGTYKAMNKSSVKDIIELVMRMPGWKAEVKDLKERHALVRFYYGVENPIEFESDVQFKIVHRTCDDCFKRSAGYYEAVVQLRGERTKVEKEYNKINKNLESRGAFISKVDKIEAGYDIYVSSKALITEYFMQRRLKPKKSFTQYGMKGGMRLYRNTYFLQLQ
jgi:NMD protein affecting ribosome stability and mRNA decay